jgi:hypothetical protein
MCLPLLVAQIAWASLATTRPSDQELKARIAALETRIDTLQTTQAQRNAEIQQSIRTVMADADSQSGQDVDFPNGWDPGVGFVLQSAGGDYSLHPGVILQFRNETTYREKIPPGGGGETGSTGYNIENGFEVTRARLLLEGNVISPNFTYFLQLADDSTLGQPTLLDAYIMYRISQQSPIAVKAGQFKDPVWHEANLLPSMLMAVDRSVVNQLIGGGQTDRVEGAEVIYDQDRLRDLLAFTNGYNSQNSKFVNHGGQGTEVGAGEGVTPTNFGISGRGEYLLVGNREPDYNPFVQYDQFTALDARQDIVIVGGGFDYSESGRDKILFHSVDVEYNGPAGWSAYAAYLASYREADTDKGAPGGYYYDDGFLVQAAYLFGSSIEPFVRYDYTYLNGNSLPGINKDVIHEITMGANWYIHGQKLKATLDASWLPNGIPTDAEGLGLLQDDGHNEFTLRAQMQVAL